MGIHRSCFGRLVSEPLPGEHYENQAVKAYV